MRRGLICVLSGCGLLFALSGCTTSEDGPLSCLSNQDCPPGCQCGTSDIIDRCLRDIQEASPGDLIETALCGGTCDRSTICSEGTSCRFERQYEHQSRTLLWYACLPDSGTGGGGGAGGTGGTALSCATACGELKCVEFSDGSFVMSDWNDAKVYATPNTYGVDQLTDDGNDAPSRFTSHRVGMESSIWVAHTKKGADYDPGVSGAIDSIHCAFDGRALEGSRQASVRALLEQDGRWFWTPFDEGYGLIDENGWAYREWSPASWEPAGHSVDLDLSAPISFGFATGASHTTGVAEVTRNTGVDNWHVVICKKP